MSWRANKTEFQFEFEIQCIALMYNAPEFFLLQNKEFECVYSALAHSHSQSFESFRTNHHSLTHSFSQSFDIRIHSAQSKQHTYSLSFCAFNVFKNIHAHSHAVTHSLIHLPCAAEKRAKWRKRTNVRKRRKKGEKVHRTDEQNIGKVKKSIGMGMDLR